MWFSAGWVAWAATLVVVAWVQRRRRRKFDLVLSKVADRFNALLRANLQIGQVNHDLVERNRNLIEQARQLEALNDALRCKVREQRGDVDVVWTPTMQQEFIGQFSKN